MWVETGWALAQSTPWWWHGWTKEWNPLVVTWRVTADFQCQVGKPIYAICSLKLVFSMNTLCVHAVMYRSGFHLWRTLWIQECRQFLLYHLQDLEDTHMQPAPTVSITAALFTLLWLCMHIPMCAGTPECPANAYCYNGSCHCYPGYSGENCSEGVLHRNKGVNIY